MKYRAWSKTVHLLMSACLLFGLPMLAAEAKEKKEKKTKKEDEVRIPFSPSGGWEAFLKGPQGEQFILQQPVEKNDDIHWLGLQFTAFEGPRFRMAVMKVENKIETARVEVEYEDDDDRRKAQESISRAAIPLGSLEGLVTAALFNTNRFELIERKQIDAVLTELKFNSTELVSGPSASKVGRLLGAQYMLFVEVAEFNDNRNMMATIGFAKTKAQVAVTFRLLEVASGRIEYAQTFRGEAGSWGLALPFWGQQENSPIHYALSVCVSKAAYDLSKSLKDKPWMGAVAKVDGEIVTLNAGSTQGLKPGMTLTALSKGEDLIDPATGAFLGTDDEVIGSLQITSVRDNHSKAAVLEGCKGLKLGDRVEIQNGGAIAPIVQTAVKAPPAAAPAKSAVTKNPADPKKAKGGAR